MQFNVQKCKVMRVGGDDKGLNRLSQYSMNVRSIKRSFRPITKSPDVLLNLRDYKTIVRPHLEYCVSAWSPHYQKHKKLLKQVQHRFTRIIPDLRSPAALRRQTFGHWKNVEIVQT